MAKAPKRRAVKTAAKKVAKKKAPPAAPKRPEEVSETCLQMHCKQWLDKDGIWDRLLIFHVGNERKGGPGTGMHFKRMGIRPGVGDWLAFTPNRMYAIELKDKDGVQSKEQKKFQHDWEATGGVYFIVRTLEEFQGVVTGILLFA